MKKLALDYLLRTKERFPDKAAVVDQDRSISFAELWRQAVDLGFRLSRATRAWDVPVVIDLPKSIDAVIAFVAVQSTGNIYVPFDPETPVERRRRVLESLGRHFVIDCDDHGFRLDGEPLAEAGATHETMEAALRRGLERRHGLDPLYIIFTSGSTGVPKGVTIANASVIDYIDWATGVYAIDERETIGNQAPFYFDNSVLDLYLTFAQGCTLHLLSQRQFLFLPSLLDYIKEHRINFFFCVPSLLSNIAALRLLDEESLPSLKKVLFAGEAMPPATLQYLRDRLPHALLSNLYGPTEITVDCIYRIFGDELDVEDSVPLGEPCENSRIVFLDEQQQVIEEPDRIAEICVGGIGVSLGYWNDAAKTAAAFIQHPGNPYYREVLYKTGDLGYRSSKNGLIYTVGRKDDQIKHMGHRIEPGEIESALNRLPRIVQSSVQYDADRKAIVAFYCAEDGLNIGDVRKALAAELPPYMLPREFVAVERIPMTPNGKADRAALWKLRPRGSGGRSGGGERTP